MHGILSGVAHYTASVRMDILLGRVTHCIYQWRQSKYYALFSGREDRDV